MVDSVDSRGSNDTGDAILDESAQGRAIRVDSLSASMESESCAYPGTFADATLRKKPGRKCRTGEDFRLAPAEESAIMKAIRSAAACKGQFIFLPSEGMLFNSREEAKEFYNLYSWERGFGIRYGRERKNDGLYRTRQDLICSCAGFSAEKNSSSIHTGCLAKMRLLRTDDDGWYVSSFCDEHNHRISQSFGKNKQWPSHGQIDSATKDFITRMRENNVSLGRICNILGVSHGDAPSGLRREAVRSVCAKVAQEELRDDIGKTLSLLEGMKSSDALMQVCFQLDSERRIKAMLWCSGRNITDYGRFGDAVTFDTTYRTNLYSLPFGLFMGVNNHFQSIVLGGVLLTTEKTVDFEWAFKSFVDIMGGHGPKTMLTDQCAAMAKALRNVLPATRHRWCRWHVLKSAKERLGNVYSKHKKFKEEFNTLITDEIDIEAFEHQWSCLLRKYRLVKKKYLSRLYKYRHMWEKPYFMDVFCAGMTSTQRSESANHMLKRFIQRAAPMHLFVRKFNEMQVDRHDQLGTQVSHKLRIGVPIEEHARVIYTRAMYEMFYDELFACGSFSVENVSSTCNYVVVQQLYDGNKDPKRFNVFSKEVTRLTVSVGFLSM